MCHFLSVYPSLQERDQEETFPKQDERRRHISS